MSFFGMVTAASPALAMVTATSTSSITVPSRAQPSSRQRSLRRCLIGQAALRYGREPGEAVDTQNRSMNCLSLSYHWLPELPIMLSQAAVRLASSFLFMMSPLARPPLVLILRTSSCLEPRGKGGEDAADRRGKRVFAARPGLVSANRRSALGRLALLTCLGRLVRYMASTRLPAGHDFGSTGEPFKRCLRCR